MFRRPWLALFALLGTVPLASCGKEKAHGHVRVDLFVMSQCQFGWELLNELLPLREEFGESLDLHVNYVGAPTSDGTLAAFGGPSAMLGDKLQLCARELSGTAPWLTFISCQGEHPEQVPEGWQACADRAHIDSNVLASCAFGGHGDALLGASYAATAARRVNASPTLFIRGEEYKGGRSRVFLGQALCKALEGKHPACESPKQAAPIETVIVSDRRCTQPGCATDRIHAFLAYTFANLKVREVDFSTPEGEELYARTGAKQLPTVVLPANLVDDAWGHAHVKAAARPIAGGKPGYFIEFPSGFSPLSVGSSAEGTDAPSTSLAVQVSNPTPPRAAP